MGIEYAIVGIISHLALLSIQNPPRRQIGAVIFLIDRPECSLVRGQKGRRPNAADAAAQPIMREAALIALLSATSLALITSSSYILITNTYFELFL